MTRYHRWKQLRHLAEYYPIFPFQCFCLKDSIHVIIITITTTNVCIALLWSKNCPKYVNYIISFSQMRDELSSFLFLRMGMWGTEINNSPQLHKWLLAKLILELVISASKVCALMVKSPQVIRRVLTCSCL